MRMQARTLLLQWPPESPQCQPPALCRQPVRAPLPPPTYPRIPRWSRSRGKPQVWTDFLLPWLQLQVNRCRWTALPRNCENPAMRRFVRGRVESLRCPRCNPKKNKSQTLSVVGRKKRSFLRESPLPPSPTRDHPKTRGGRRAAGLRHRPQGSVHTENRAPLPSPPSERRGLGGLRGVEVATTKHCPTRDREWAAG